MISLIKAKSLARVLKRSSSLFCFIIFLSALFIRGAFQIAILGIDRPLEGDEGIYYKRAVEISSADFLGDSQRPPLLGALVSIVYIFTGENVAVGRLVNIVISSLASPLIYVLVLSLAQRDMFAKLASIVWTIYPPSVWYSGAFLTESLSSVLVLILAISLIRMARHCSWKSTVFTGLSLGLLVLNRSIYIFIPVGVLICLIGSNFLENKFERLRMWNVWIKYTCLILLTWLVLTPWIVHNLILLGHFVPHSTQGGQVLMYSNGNLNHPDIQAGKYVKEDEIIERVTKLAQLDEYKADSLKRSHAIDSIKSNWFLLPKPLVNRFKNFWTARPDPYDNNWTVSDWIMTLIWVPTFTLFLVALFKNPLKNTWPLLLIVGYASITVLPFWGIPRFRFPVDSLVIVMATIGIIALCSGTNSGVLQREKDKNG